MKLLTGPFGFGDGDSVSITCAGPVDEAALTDILIGYSCYPPAIPKIVACLRASHRYDCTLQTAWFRKQHLDLTRELAAIGVRLEITNQCDWVKGSFAHRPYWPDGRPAGHE